MSHYGSHRFSIRKSPILTNRLARCLCYAAASHSSVVQVRIAAVPPGKRAMKWHTFALCAGPLEAGAKTIVSHGPDRVKALAREFSPVRLGYPAPSPKTPDAAGPSVMCRRLPAPRSPSMLLSETLERMLKPWCTQEIPIRRRMDAKRSRRQARERAPVQEPGRRDRRRPSQRRQHSSDRASSPVSSFRICCG